MLTNAAVKAARPSSRAFKMYDERGLFLFVTPAGAKSWRFRYRIAGKEKLLCFGLYPELQLLEARELADAARDKISAGQDPANDQTVSSAEQLETIARAWHDDRRGRWSDVHAVDVMASLENDVFPVIGARSVDAIGPLTLLELVQSIEARGAHETARRVRQRLDGIFAFAMVRGHCSSNPAAMITAELTPAPIGVQKHPALVEIEQLRELLHAADQVDAAAIVKLASRFLALTAVRVGSLLKATGEEIEDLDGAQPIWRIPAMHMKLTKARKADAANEHIVPLSPAAVQLLLELREKFGYEPRSRRLFPIGEGAIGDLYSRAGYAGRHVPHGWRASFSTILNERRPADAGVIDQALAHVPTNKVEAAYNRAEHLARRREIYCEWAELLMPKPESQIS